MRVPRGAEQQGRAGWCAGRCQPSSAGPGEEVSLTERERVVLDLIATGRSNAELAACPHFGVTTVKTQLAKLTSKTGSRNRVPLAGTANRFPRPPG
jgi:DNA-binding CsgD family transcriptional regulator